MSERKIKASSKTATKKNKKTIKTKKAVVKKQPVKKTTKKKVAVTTRKKVEKKEALVGDLGFTPIVDRNQIDTQKKFYQELSKEIDQKHLEGDIDENVVENNNSEKIYRQPASIGLYRKRAFFFIALTAILILLMVKRAKKKGDRKPEYAMPVRWWIIGLLTLVFLAGVVRELILAFR